MELIFVTLGGLIIGLIARYSLPNRPLTGAVAIPALATAVACVVWEILTWARLPYNAPWIWVITFVASAVAAVVVNVWISRRRKHSDAEAFEAALKGARQA